MKVLKGLLLSLLSFLLFLSLSLFGIAFTLKSTVLNANFMVAEVNKLNLSVVVKDIVETQYARQLPTEYQFLKEPVYKIISEQEPWLKQQAGNAIRAFYDFMLGKSDKLSLLIPLDSLKANLKDSVKQAFLKQLPPQLAGVPPAMIEQYFDQFYQQFAAQVPAKIEFTETQIPPDVMVQFQQAKQWIGYFQTIYNLLIVFMIILVAGIVLLQLEVRAITRGLGVTFLTFGAFEYAGIWLAKHFTPQGLSLPGMQIPPSLQAWLSQLTMDFAAPLEKFSLGCAVGGVVLIIVSFVYPKRVEAPA